MDKKSLSERDICTKFITPAIVQAGWDRDRQIREEYSFTDGRVLLEGEGNTRGSQKRADYVLLYQPNLPLAIVEAKNNNLEANEGLLQAIDYAEILDIPFAYSSNGDVFIEHDLITNKQRLVPLEEFPSPSMLWQRYKEEKGITEDQAELILEPYHFENEFKVPRYYQRNAINRTIEAIAKGQNRILLVMATGTGKTYTAFQIIWRLRNQYKGKKILFLADRNILVDQTMQNDFQPFKNVMTKVEHRQMDSSYEVFMALYQQLSGASDEMEIFRQFSPSFFDVIIVDEAHRGSARDDSNWRKILEYFDSAIQIGLTATPKETEEVSNSSYFGEPVYTYSLKQGIDDGFLAPYRVVRVNVDKDTFGYQPSPGETDNYGQVMDRKLYQVKDFDRTLILPKRNELVAKRVTEFLKKTDRFAKTIVFCVDEAHAERMTECFKKENEDLVSEFPHYVTQITGKNKDGKAQLDNFIDEDSRFPTIVTTCKLLTTGVDCKTCKVIVLDNNFGENGMTEFKQIIGRGTRLKPEYGKTFFTVIDFRNATRLFSDPEFDGEPEQVHEVTDGEDMVPPMIENSSVAKDNQEFKGSGEMNRKFYASHVNVEILKEHIVYFSRDGKRIEENLMDYSKSRIVELYPTEQEFVDAWLDVERKNTIIQAFVENGLYLGELKKRLGEDVDEFDLILSIGYDQKLITRSERAQVLRESEFMSLYPYEQQRVIEKLIERYEQVDIQEEGKEKERFDFKETKFLKYEPFIPLGNLLSIIKLFDGKKKYLEMIYQLEYHLYAEN